MKQRKSFHSLILALVGICLLASCAQPAGPSATENGNTDNSAFNKQKVEAAKAKLSVVEKLPADEKNLYLPTFIDDVNISWKSDNKDVIEPNDMGSGRGFVQSQDKNITVKLTATLSYKNYTDKKEFSVLVYGKNTPLDNKTKLNFAASKLDYGRITEEVDKITINLPTTIEYNAENGELNPYADVKVSWECSTANVTLQDNKLTANRLDNSYTLNFKAILTLKEEKVTKDFIYEVPKKANKVYSDGHKTLTIYDDKFEINSIDGDDRVRYTYRKDKNDLYVKLDAKFVQGKWRLKDELEQLYTSMYQVDFTKNMIKSLEETPTIENLENFLKKSYPILDTPKFDIYEYLIQIGAYTDKDAAKKAPEKEAVGKVLNYMVIQYGSEIGLTAEEIKVQTALQVYNKYVEYMFESMGLSDFDWNEFKAEFKEDTTNKTAILSTVLVEGDPIEQQRGSFESDSTSERINLEIRNRSFNKGYLNYQNKTYNVTFTDNFTKGKAVSDSISSGEQSQSIDFDLSYDKKSGIATFKTTDKEVKLNFTAQRLY